MMDKGDKLPADLSVRLSRWRDQARWNLRYGNGAMMAAVMRHGCELFEELNKHDEAWSVQILQEMANRVFDMEALGIMDYGPVGVIE